MFMWLMIKYLICTLVNAISTAAHNRVVKLGKISLVLMDV